MKKWVVFYALAVVYGSGFMFINMAVQEVPPVTLTAIRLTLGGILLNLYIRYTGESYPSDWRTWLWLFVIGTLNVSVPFTLVSWAQEQGVESGVSSVLLGINPLFTVVLAHFAFADDRMTVRKVLGVVIGFVGVIVLSARNFEGGVIQEESAFIGHMAIIVAAFSFAVSGVMIRNLLKDRISPQMAAASTVMAGAITLDLLVLVMGLSGASLMTGLDISARAMIAITYLILLNTFIAYIAIYYVIRELGVTTTSTLVYVVAPISLFMGAIFLGEIIDTYVIIGTVVILLGLTLPRLKFNPGKLYRGA